MTESGQRVRTGSQERGLQPRNCESCPCGRSLGPGRQQRPTGDSRLAGDFPRLCPHSTQGKILTFTCGHFLELGEMLHAVCPCFLKRNLSAAEPNADRSFAAALAGKLGHLFCPVK